MSGPEQKNINDSYIADMAKYAAPNETPLEWLRAAGAVIKCNKTNDIAYSIRISSKNFGFENGIKSVPLYAVFCV